MNWRSRLHFSILCIDKELTSSPIIFIPWHHKNLFVSSWVGHPTLVNSSIKDCLLLSFGSCFCGCFPISFFPYSRKSKWILQIHFCNYLNTDFNTFIKLSQVKLHNVKYCAGILVWSTYQLEIFSAKLWEKKPNLERKSSLTLIVATWCPTRWLLHTSSRGKIFCTHNTYISPITVRIRFTHIHHTFHHRIFVQD